MELGFLLGLVDRILLLLAHVGGIPMNWSDYATPMPFESVLHLVSYHNQNEYLDGQTASMTTACNTLINPEPPFKDTDVPLCAECYAKACPTCMGRVWVTRLGRWVSTRETVNMVCQTCGKDYNNG